MNMIPMMALKMMTIMISLPSQIVGDSEGRKNVPSFAGNINIGPVGGIFSILKSLISNTFTFNKLISS